MRTSCNILQCLFIDTKQIQYLLY